MPRIFLQDEKWPTKYGTRWDLAAADWRECVKASTVPPPGLAIDTETTGFEWHDEAFCATIAWEDLMGRVVGHYLPFPEGLDTLRKIMLSAHKHGAPWIFHNAGFDLKKLIALGVVDRGEVEYNTFMDTQALAIYLDNLQPLKLKGTGDKNLVARYLQRDQTEEFEALKVVKSRIGLKKDDGYHMLPANVLVPYSIKDAKDTYEIYRECRRVGADRLPRWQKMLDREMRVAMMLLDAETAGMAVDVPYLELQRDELGIRLIDNEDRIREMANQITGKTDWTPPSQQVKRQFDDQMSFDGVEPPKRGRSQKQPFNAGSTDQLAEVLMALGYTLEKTEKGAWQVDKKALERCSRKNKHPFLEQVTEYRRLAKLHGTYVTGILSEHVDGVLHTSFRQYGTRTGRFSSGKEEE